MIKESKYLAKRAYVGYLNLKFKINRLQMLFVYGHMRSGSSLLVHLLNSNPEIIGYGETKHVYHCKSDFGKIAFHIYRSFKTWPSDESYILDKVLHTYLINDASLMQDAKTIFLLRPPNHALPSIYKLNLDDYTPLATFNYYVERLDQIQTFAHRIDSNKWSFLTYDMLINNQAVAFKRIEKFLSLGTKLTNKYDTIWSTGKRGVGDSSDKIQRGKIITERKEVALPHLFEPFINQAVEKYAECYKELRMLNSL